MTYKKLLINIIFAATFFNHLHVLSFIPSHNRPLLLLLFPLVIIYIHKYNIKVHYDLILWIVVFFVVVVASILSSIFFGYYDTYFPEIISRLLSYLVLFYFFIVGIIFYGAKEYISNKFYYFLIIIGFIQVYAMIRLPFSEYIIYLFDNHLISSFSSVSGSVLFFEAEPSYVAFMIIFIMVMYETKNMRIFVLLSLFTLSVRTTFVSLLYYIKKHLFIYGTIITVALIVFLSATQLSYSVFYRVKALITFQQLDPSTYIRVVNNKIALNMIKDYPILGVGPGQYSSYYTGKYLSNYDTRKISELENVLLEKTKNADPYSFILGLGSELGIFGLIWISITGAFFLFKTSRKYLVSLLILILMWGYPYGKPYIWILFGYIYQEYRLLKLNKINRFLS